MLSNAPRKWPLLETLSVFLTTSPLERHVLRYATTKDTVVTKAMEGVTKSRGKSTARYQQHYKGRCVLTDTSTLVCILDEPTQLISS